MNDAERMVLKMMYLENPKKMGEDMEGLGNVMETLFGILGDEKEVSKMSPLDMLDILCDMKEFGDRMKKYCIKYGIVLPLMEQKGGD